MLEDLKLANPEKVEAENKKTEDLYDDGEGWPDEGEGDNEEVS